MKILWHSNAPWATTGYGTQTALFVPRFVRAGHDVAISAFWGLAGAAIEWNGIRVYPGDDASWGDRLLPAYAAHHGGDNPRGTLVLTLMDVWVLRNYAGLRMLPLASWCPVDHEPLPQIVRPYFAATGARAIAMSRFGKRMFAAAGIDALYVPHGVDTTVFQPRDDRDAVRDALGLPRDAFVAGMVAFNKGTSPPRKAFPEVFDAFAVFCTRHSDAVLYVHTDPTPHKGGINLRGLAEMVGLQRDRVVFGPRLELELGIPQEAMSHIYSAMDVLVATSYGEGFGVPIVEAQACGVPVITTDATAMPELTGAGWCVGGDRFYDPTQGAFYARPRVAEIVDRLEAAYDRAASLSEQARSFALQYDADLVMERYWVPVLAELEGLLHENAAKELVT